MKKIIEENGIVWLEEIEEFYGAISIKRTKIGEHEDKPKKKVRKRKKDVEK